MKTNLQHSDGLGGKCPGCEDCNPKVARSPIRADAFWVVERFENGRSAGYWDGGSSRDFQMDIDKAIQFRRKEDAFWATRGWHWKDVKLTEHLMVDSVVSPPEAQETAPVARAEPSRGAPDAAPPTRSQQSRGAMKAAMTIAAFTTLNSKNGIPWAAEVIDRETGHVVLLEALRGYQNSHKLTSPHGCACLLCTVAEAAIQQAERT